MPKVSVILTSYNHGKYVADAINSVLQSDFEDFELIVLDDCSTDNSREIISNIKDPRIKFISNDENVGMVRNVNNGIRIAAGEYIAHLNSDDLFCDKTKLSKQVKFLDENSEHGAVFTRVRVINKKGANFTDKNNSYYSIFDKEKNQDRRKWLNSFFYHSNSLCYPSAMVRKSCYKQVGLFNPSYTIMLDLDMWIRLCKVYQIHIIEEKLTAFRVSDASASCQKISEFINAFEAKKLLKHYLDFSSVEEFNKIFPEFKTEDVKNIPYLIGKACIRLYTHYRAFGLEVLFDKINCERDLDVLNKNGLSLRGLICTRNEFLNYRDLTDVTLELIPNWLGKVINPIISVTKKNGVFRVRIFRIRVLKV